ncbi:MAG: efflux transporter outer membrane subunit [Betaproteobacteria bacterium]|nr:efflux transporter outer membrane subunit [Betaproteobacteria bacterium]
MSCWSYRLSFEPEASSVTRRASGLALAAAALTLTFCGCSGVPLPRLPDATPSHWHHATGPVSRSPADLHDWWKAFHDPLLDHLVAEALEANLDVAIAREHLLAERALYGSRQAPTRPSLRVRTDDPIDPDASASYFVIGFDATWELSLFGRGKALDRIAGGHLQEAVGDLRDARVSLVAEVAREVIRLRAAQQELLLRGAILRAREHQLALTTTRAQLDLADAADVARARAAVADARGDMAGPQFGADAAAQRLAVLLGLAEADPAWMKPAELPRLGTDGPVAAPAELLRSRPEIASAEARVLEAAGELGIAHADRYPRIGLGTSLLWSTNIASYDLHHGTNDIGTAGPQIDIPLFDWGLREAREHAQSHRLQAAVLAYRKAVLEGVADVETALGKLQQQGQRERDAEQAVAASQQAAQAGRVRRRLGLASDLDGAGVEVSALQANLELTAARSDHDIAYVALYKALGGAPPLPDGDHDVSVTRTELR